MSTLSHYLPPFASDYTGAASALFDLDCLVAINDGSCCTSHYASYDEPRWATGQKQTLCTNLRMNDTIFGIDERIIDQLGTAAHDLGASRVVALGTPVPAVIGTDMQGLAADLQSASGIAADGIDTSGFNTYVVGIMKAFRLISRNIEPAFGEIAHSDNRVVNVLGMTPLDYGAQNSRALEEALAAMGFAVGCNFFMGEKARHFQEASQACCNIAVSYAGLLMADDLQKRFGTPFIASSLMGSNALAHVEAQLKNANTTAAPSLACKGAGRILIVGDQVIAHTLRQAIRGAAKGAAPRICVASFFGIYQNIAEEGDLHLPSEEALLRHLREHAYDLVIGDPLLRRIPQLDDRPFLDLVHPAVSSRRHWNDVPFIGERPFDKLAAQAVALTRHSHAPSSDELAISASGEVEIDQFSGIPSKQSMMGDR